MFNADQTNPIAYSLLIIIIERGKGSKLLDFALRHGAIDASCLLAKGTVRSSVLQLIEMNEVDKEIVITIVPATIEALFLEKLNKRFHFDRPHHGIAFKMSLAGILKIKKDANVKWKKASVTEISEWEYTALFMVVNKGQAEKVIEISQNAGYYGGTIIKARGTSNQIDRVLNMVVDPEKEAVLMIMESQRAQHLADLLYVKLQLDQPNTGFLCKIGVEQALGLYRQVERKEGAGQ